MDCIQSIQKAIDYMEANMLENISYEDAARHLHMSNCHFHRLFSMLTGMTANEYIRSRRLSMAGQELIMSDAKIIDIALKYDDDFELYLENPAPGCVCEIWIPVEKK